MPSTGTELGDGGLGEVSEGLESFLQGVQEDTSSRGRVLEACVKQRGHRLSRRNLTATANGQCELDNASGLSSLSSPLGNWAT